jgi:hypothetical protein
MHMLCTMLSSTQPLTPLICSIIVIALPGSLSESLHSLLFSDRMNEWKSTGLWSDQTTNAMANSAQPLGGCAVIFLFFFEPVSSTDHRGVSDKRAACGADGDSTCAQ